jgi:hypothetical protein
MPNGREIALSLALQTFPELEDRFEDPGDDFLSDVYYVYGLLATEIVNRWVDRQFRHRACMFIDRLANSGDSLLEELLVVGLLERLAEDAALATEAKACVSAKAAWYLSKVESEMFGR